MKNWRIIILLVISVGVFAIFFFTDHKNFEKAIKHTSDILKLLFSFITLYLALKIYDRYGVDKKLTEKRTDLLIELLTELRKVQFSVLIEHRDEFSLGFHFTPSKNLDSYFKDKNIPSECWGAQVLIDFTSKQNAVKEIMLIRSNPLLPKEISQKIEFLRIVSAIFSEEVKNLKSKAKIRFPQQKGEKLEDKDWKIDSYNDCTLKEFLIKFQQALVEIETWINKHSNLNEEFNI